MVAASMLGPQDRLRMYTDVHSFSQVHFSVNTINARRNSIQRALLADFTQFHIRLPGAKDYVDLASGPGSGIGSTDEYFAETFQIPSWTLEVEPSGTLSGIRAGALRRPAARGRYAPDWSSLFSTLFERSRNAPSAATC